MSMKKVVGLFCACLVLLSVAVLPVKVQESKDAESLDVSDFSVSERLTFSEMLDRYAENNGISYEEASEPVNYAYCYEHDWLTLGAV